MIELIVFGLIMSVECVTDYDQDVFLSSGQYSVDIDPKGSFLSINQEATVMKEAL